MKKIFMLAMVLAALPSFAQEDEYAKFQGVWYVEDEGVIQFIAFVNDTFMMTTDSYVFGQFIITDDTIKLTVEKASDGHTWWGSTGVDDYTEFKFIFSSSKLILVSEGQSLVFTKVNE
jgi:hypothetical protein